MSRVAQRKIVPALTLAASAGLVSLMGSAAYAQTVGNWIGPTQSLWSNPAAWQGGIIPNGVGDTAQYTPGSSQIAINDIANVTVGTLKVTGTGSNSMQFTPNQVIVMDQDGAGPGRAQWINDMQLTAPGVNTNSALFLNNPAAGNTGFFLLNDDLLISNTSNTTRASGAIQVRGPISGFGKTITFENVSNNIAVAQIALTNPQSNLGGNAFAGNWNIAKGAVTFTRGDIFSPNPGNIVTIGAAGMGDATLAAVGGGLGNIENGFVVAANTGGTSRFVANSSNANNIQIKSTNTNAAFITLNGDLTFENRASNGSIFIIGDPMQGVGQVTKAGVGPMEITHTSSHSGGTVVSEGSLKLRHADAFNNGFGFYAATDGTLGSGDVTVTSQASQLELDTTSTGINVIADTAALDLAASGGNGKAALGAGVNETVGGLVINGVAQTANGTYGSTASGAAFPNDSAFSGTGVVTLALGRVLHWDINGATPGAGGATPSGDWNGTALSFNTDSSGGGGGTLSRTTLATDPVVFTAGTDGTGAYTVNISGTPQSASVSIARGDVTFAGAALATGAFDIAAGATARVAAGVTTALDVGNLTVAPTGRLDVNDSGVVRRNGGSGATGQSSTQQLTAYLKTGLENGGAFDWRGPGISSTEAFNDNTTAGSVLYGVGILQNNLAGAGVGDGTTTDATAGNEIYTTFKGRTVALNDTLVRYTYMGDADLDGSVTGTDYSLIDSGFAFGLSGWLNGDFDYSGMIDSTDYALIDNAFAFQTGPLSPAFLALYDQHVAMFGQSYVDAFAMVQSGVVPEPGTMGVLAMGALGLLARRRNRRQA